MKKYLSMIALLTVASLEAFGFHAVTEILPSGKVLICKDYGQVRKGNLVEVYVRAKPQSRSDFSMTKTHEIKLPEIGQKITLLHRDFHSKGKNVVHHSQELGTALVSGESLEGEDRIDLTMVSNKAVKKS